MGKNNSVVKNKQKTRGYNWQFTSIRHIINAAFVKTKIKHVLLCIEAGENNYFTYLAPLGLQEEKLFPLDLL